MLWLRTDETKEAINALELFGDFLERVDDDIYFWKWCIITLHSALQGFMVLSLNNLGSFEYVAKKTKYIRWLSGDTTLGVFKPKLKPFPKLYEKIKNSKLMAKNRLVPFNAKIEHDQAVSRLTILRNNLVHFTPKGYSISIIDLPQVALFCLEIVSFLALETDNITFYQERTREDLRSFVDELAGSLETLRYEYIQSAKLERIYEG